MSLYTFAAASLTTADDKKRCPAVDRGQVTRIVAFCLTLALALIVMAHRQSRAAEDTFHGAHSAMSLPADAQDAVHGHSPARH